IGYAQLASVIGLPELPDDDIQAEQIIEQIEVQAIYSGYIERQSAEIERQRAYEETALPAALDYASVSGLSREVQSRLAEVRPATLGQAGRVPGVTPAAVSLLLVHLKKTGQHLQKSA